MRHNSDKNRGDGCCFQETAGFLYLWDADSGDKLREFELDPGLGTSTSQGAVQFSPDGTLIAAAYYDHLVPILNVDTGEIVQTLEHTQDVVSAGFHPDGSQIVTVDSDGVVRTWDVASGDELKRFGRDAETQVTMAQFSPDGKQIIGSGETIYVWDIGTGDTVLTMPGYASQSSTQPAVSADGRLILLPGATPRLIDLEKGTELLVVPGHRDFVRSAAFSTDDRRAATASLDGTARIWDVESAEVLKTLDGLDSRLFAISFSPDGALVVAASGESSFVTGNTERTLRVWDVETGELIYKLDGVIAPDQGSGIPAKSVAVTSDGNIIALADKGVAYTVEGSSGKVLHQLGEPCEDRFDCENVHYVALSPDGSSAATVGGVTPVVRVWDTTTGAEIRRIEGLRGGGGPLSYSPDGQLLAVGGGDGVIRVWDLKTGDLRWLGGHRGGYPTTTGSFRIEDLAFSLDGKRLITGGTDGTARIWNAETGEELQIIYVELPG